MKSTIKTTKTNTALCGLISGLLSLAAGTFTAQAVVTVSDFGVTAPVLNPSTDTGNTVVNTNNEYGVRGGTIAGQTFQLPNAGVVDKVYLAYNLFGTGEPGGLANFTFRLDANNNGSYEINQSFVGVNRANFQTAASPAHWIEFDLSSANLTLSAATTHSFTVTNDEAFNAGSFIWGQYYDVTDVYANGASLNNGTDLPFVVTTTAPEPTSALLLLGSGALFLLRRRRATAR